VKGDNVCQWTQRRKLSPFYEAWYFKLNHKTDHSSLWVRFLLLNGKKEFVWAIHSPSNLEDEITQTKIIHDFTQSKESDALVSVAQNNLFEGSSQGNLMSDGHEISWDLSFEPDHKMSFLYAPPFLRPLLSSKAGTPNVNTAFTGKYIVDGKTYMCDQEPGCQGHYSGKKYAREWKWAHCNLFNEGSREAVFEIIDVKVSPLLPSLKSAFIKFHDECLVVNDLVALFGSYSHYYKNHWLFRCRQKEYEIELSITGNRDRTVDVLYTDTDGSEMICHNTKLADSALVVRKNGKVVGEWASSGTTAFEFIERV